MKKNVKIFLEQFNSIHCARVYLARIIIMAAINSYEIADFNTIFGTISGLFLNV